MARRASGYDQESADALPILVVPGVADPAERLLDIFRDTDTAELSCEERLKVALSAIGSWSDLDGEWLLDAIEQSRRERKPMPPVDDV